jgi:hypothetical protein
MGDIAQRGNRLTAAKGGRIGKFGGGRTNLLEQLGRVEAEPSNPNRRAEISRVHGELNRGYAKGGRAGFSAGREVGKALKKFRDIATHEVPTGPHTDVRRRKINPSFMKRVKRGSEIYREKLKKLAEKKGIDPSETFGGIRTQTKGGPQPILPKRKDDVGVGGYQEPLENRTERPLGVGGIKKGGRIGLKGGSKSKPWGTGPKPGTLEFLQHTTQTPRKKKAIGGVARGARKAAETFTEKMGGSAEGKPHSTKEGRIASGKRKITRFLGRHADRYKNPKGKFPPEKPIWSDMPRKPLEKSKMQPLKKGGKADKNWIQKAVNPKHKGYCTPMTKKTCTPARKALARTFKKKAKTGW